MSSEAAYQAHVANAVRHFWNTRQKQNVKQKQSGQSDRGSRSAVTGGKQMDGFVELITQVIVDSGIPSEAVFAKSQLELPGYFRSEKKWDLLVVENETLIVAIEFKSQIGPSFSSNFNNRSEEAIGTAHDIWTAFREGAFSTSTRPWLGYLMMLDDCEKSNAPVSVRQPHFPVFPEFVNSSYSQRYQILLTKMIRERLYDAGWFLMSSASGGLNGEFTTPAEELSTARFISSLKGHLMAYSLSKGSKDSST